LIKKLKAESVNDKLNNLHKGYLSIDAASLRGLGFNKSGPIALDVSSIFNISSTSFSVIVICSRPLINISQRKLMPSYNGKNFGKFGINVINLY
jgi:hypothetical protein